MTPWSRYYVGESLILETPAKTLSWLCQSKANAVSGQLFKTPRELLLECWRYLIDVSFFGVPLAMKIIFLKNRHFAATRWMSSRVGLAQRINFFHPEEWQRIYSWIHPVHSTIVLIEMNYKATSGNERTLALPLFKVNPTNQTWTPCSAHIKCHSYTCIFPI